MASTHPVEINSGITTTWIPLTTPGPSAPAGCSGQMYMQPGLTTIVAFDAWQGLNVPFALQCLPIEVTQSYTQTSAGVTGSTRFSLGPFQCPNEYTTASTTILNSLSTSVLCCPSEYRLSSSGTYLQCMSTQTTGSVVPNSLVISDGTRLSWVDTTVTASGTVILANSIIGYVFADQVTSSSGTSSTGASSTSTPAQTQGPATTTSITPTQTPQMAYNHGLDTGAKAGIAVGCVVAALAVIILFIICSPRYRRKQTTIPSVAYEKDGSTPATEQVIGELGTNDVNYPSDSLLGGRYQAAGGLPKQGNMYNNNNNHPGAHFVHEMDGLSPARQA
ncbi:uncharacterized protein LY89DRAFT_212046 [Mollisia scopiformis]|uniref:Uncharacterized protein n=1 Tax=Mollisia scopiformis TaxID=149040 RepID=A0A194WYA7_MOLSC|nr:uncharacterized protein LY89DRAFT_212046 [Mollisia scopiformis]KUJ12669.1 hypothetical protein LY89DRAFT_212046 [Mollisia scopiformis]